VIKSLTTMMNILHNKLAAIFFVFILLGSSCNTVQTNKNSLPGSSKATYLTDINFTVEDAPEWTTLFLRHAGWFGGDGIFVIPENGKDQSNNDVKRTILFSDTMIGEINNGVLKPGFVMIHNSVATIQGSDPKSGKLEFHFDKKKDGSPESIFIPSTPDSRPGDYYWLGDGYVNKALDGNTYLFGYRIRDVKDKVTFAFEHVGTTIIIIPKGSKPPYQDQKQIDFPFFLAEDSGDPTALGSGIYVNTKSAGAKNPDGHIYVYGVKGKEKALVAARVPEKDFENFDKWRFWNGRSWVDEPRKMTKITDRLSNELSVSLLPDGRYGLFFQVDGIGSMIGLRIGSSPIGPFGPIIEVFDSKKALVDKNIFSYNAKAHPALSKPGQLLISYNVNSFDFNKDILAYPNLYRPRFVNVKF